MYDKFNLCSIMDNFYQIIQSSHSGFRWITLLALFTTTVIYFVKWQRAAGYTKGDKTLFSITLSIVHIQVLVGVVLYFLSPKVMFSGAAMSTRLIRFFTVEHSLIMLIAAVLLTMGSVKLKRKSTAVAKFKTGFWFTLLTLIIILVAIPWPFQNFGAGWV